MAKCFKSSIHPVYKSLKLNCSFSKSIKRAGDMHYMQTKHILLTITFVLYLVIL